MEGGTPLPTAGALKDSREPCPGQGSLEAVAGATSPAAWDVPLAGALHEALAALPAAVPRSLLFSGGVDSGLLAWELRTDKDVTLATVGLEGSADLAAAEDAARELPFPWSRLVVREDEVLAMAHRIEGEIGTLSPTARSVEVAFAVAVYRRRRGRYSAARERTNCSTGTPISAVWTGPAPGDGERRTSSTC